MPEKIITGDRLKYQLVLSWEENFPAQYSMKIMRRIGKSTDYKEALTAEDEVSIASMIEFVDTLNGDFIFAETQAENAAYWKRIAKIAENALNSIYGDQRTPKEIADIVSTALSTMNAEALTTNGT